MPVIEGGRASVSELVNASSLADVPETMLWTLYGRAAEAGRRRGMLADPMAQEIFGAIEYPFFRRFGPPQPVFALRSLAFDRALEDFLSRYRGAQIVALGEGLETQRYRVLAPHSDWLTVDLPDALEVRERFMPPDDQHRHLAKSATDPSWMAELDSARPTFISAQGLFMYFQAAEVRMLLREITAQFRCVQVVFDVVPAWVSRASVLANGFPLTPFYRMPPMPWGINRYAVKPTLRRWLGHEADVRFRSFPVPDRGPARVVGRLLPSLSKTNPWMPSLVEVEKLA
ncbi:MAG: class I SAM-dependent methyltransferase [Pseudomonadota bacterium]